MKGTFGWAEFEKRMLEKEQCSGRESQNRYGTRRPLFSLFFMFVLRSFLSNQHTIIVFEIDRICACLLIDLSANLTTAGAGKIG